MASGSIGETKFKWKRNALLTDDVLQESLENGEEARHHVKDTDRLKLPKPLQLCPLSRSEASHMFPHGFSLRMTLVTTHQKRNSTLHTLVKDNGIVCKKDSCFKRWQSGAHAAPECASWLVIHVKFSYQHS